MDISCGSVFKVPAIHIRLPERFYCLVNFRVGGVVTTPVFLEVAVDVMLNTFSKIVPVPFVMSVSPGTAMLSVVVNIMVFVAVLVRPTLSIVVTLDREVYIGSVATKLYVETTLTVLSFTLVIAQSVP